jgi:hypothetical protein
MFNLNCTGLLRDNLYGPVLNLQGLREAHIAEHFSVFAIVLGGTNNSYFFAELYTFRVTQIFVFVVHGEVSALTN